MTELKPCPFCGGAGRFSFNYKRVFVRSIAPPLEVMRTEGIDLWCSKHQTIKTYWYQCKVICGRCHARGKPVLCEVENYTPYSIKYRDEAKAAYAPFMEKAADGWNRRVYDDT